MNTKTMKLMTTLLGGILFIYMISCACVEGFSKEEKDAIQQRRAARAIADEADKQWQKMLDDAE
jgi:hypothetical protein